MTCILNTNPTTQSTLATIEEIYKRTGAKLTRKGSDGNQCIIFYKKCHDLEQTPWYMKNM